jgi:peptide chain release factor 1
MSAKHCLRSYIVSTNCIHQNETTAAASTRMKPTIAAKLAQLADRLDEVNTLLSSENATRDMDAYRKLNRERSELEPVVTLYHAYQAAEADVATALEMAADPEMREFADAEVKEGRVRLEQIELDLQKQLLPKDPNDERNVFLEVRAGTGGDEAALFAGELFRMYLRFAERRRWQVEVISESAGEKGGYKEVIARIIGQGAYSVLKFESGAHRVQRVPPKRRGGCTPLRVLSRSCRKRMK